MDMRTVLGRSIAKIASLCNTENDISVLSAPYFKNAVKYAQVPVNEAWRIGVIEDMKNFLNSGVEGEGLASIEASEILNFACTS